MFEVHVHCALYMLCGLSWSKRCSAPDLSSGVVGVWVRVQVMGLVSLTETLLGPFHSHGLGLVFGLESVRLIESL